MSELKKGDNEVLTGSGNVFKDLQLSNADELLMFSAQSVDVSLATLMSRISKEHDKRGGKPCIVGTRITVQDIMSYLASGMTVEAILEDFPYLEIEDIRACFAYCSDPDNLY